MINDCNFCCSGVRRNFSVSSPTFTLWIHSVRLVLVYSLTGVVWICRYIYYSDTMAMPTMPAMPYQASGRQDMPINYHLPVYAPTMPPHDSTKEEMYQKFQSWALRNYGDSGKTKTVTRRKYNRIVRILAGEEPATTENSKFRFWVKGKAFRLGPVNPSGEYRILYVPTKSSLVSEILNFYLFKILHTWIFFFWNSSELNLTNTIAILIMHCISRFLQI